MSQNYYYILKCLGKFNCVDFWMILSVDSQLKSIFKALMGNIVAIIYHISDKKRIVQY